MLSRSECVDQMVVIRGEIAAMVDKPVLTAYDEARFERLVRDFDRYDTARVCLDVGVRPENVPMVVALATG